MTATPNLIVFELSNGGDGLWSRSRVTTLYATTESAMAAAQVVFRSYDEFRDDPDTAPIYDEIIWHFDPHFFLGPRDPADKHAGKVELCGHYGDDQYFVVTEREVLP